MEVQYKIIGGDGAEYGPATLEELTSWIGDGRVARSTQVWRSDIAIWSAAARYTELQSALARLHASASPAAAAALARPAGFWARLAAYLLDRVVLAVLLGIIWAPVAQWRHWELPAVPQVVNEQTYELFMRQIGETASKAFPLLFFLMVSYDTLMNGAFGATLGKMAVGARIVRFDGSPISYNRALLRSLGTRMLEMLYYVGFLWVAMPGEKRGPHDYIAGTKVVHLR